jgi:hypothetical protein
LKETIAAVKGKVSKNSHDCPLRPSDMCHRQGSVGSHIVRLKIERVPQHSQSAVSTQLLIFPFTSIAQFLMPSFSLHVPRFLRFGRLRSRSPNPSTQRPGDDPHQNIGMFNQAENFSASGNFIYSNGGNGAQYFLYVLGLLSILTLPRILVTYSAPSNQCRRCPGFLPLLIATFASHGKTPRENHTWSRL